MNNFFFGNTLPKNEQQERESSGSFKREFEKQIEDFIENESTLETNTKLEGVLYWSNESNRNEERLRKSLKRLFFKNPKLEEKYKLQSNDIDEQLKLFLNDYFTQNISMTCFAANLSIKDEAEDRINLALRIPYHGEFIEYLPATSCICIRGYWGVRQPNPVFIPEDIFTSFNDESETLYEVELSASPSSLRPHYRCTDNILTKELAERLPAISVETAKRLHDWQEFLSFKRQLVDRRTIGLRYLTCDLNEQNNLEFLVVADNERLIKDAAKVFRRKDLEAFDLEISQENLRFALDTKKTSRIPRGQELGQLKGQIKKLKVEETKKYSEQLSYLYEQGITDPILALITIEPSEDWKNKLFNALHDIDDSTEQSFGVKTELELISETLLQSIPTQGFISFPSVGDLALIKRHEQTVKNLRQNEGCYSPYLSSYLFDITKANPSKNTEQISSWFNEDLNEAQRQAVVKMMSAPDLCLVQGPPGTGKTTVIAEAILQLARKGESILLASQSHDAIDNALSCIQNQPELRAIRLARGKGKITEEGEGFVGDKALERYYSSLNHHVQQQWIEPEKNRNNALKLLEQWIKKSEFVDYDLKKAQKDIAHIKAECEGTKDEIAQKRKDYNTAFENYDSLCNKIECTKRSITNIESGNWELLQGAHIADNGKALILALQSMSSLQLKVEDYCINFDQFKNENSSFLIANALLSYWSSVTEKLPNIHTDLIRLQSAGAGSLRDDLTKEKISKLKEREAKLADLMDENDSEELTGQWKQVRKEIRTLQKQSTGLDFSNYDCFIDATDIVNVTDASHTYQVLSQRVVNLESLNHQISEQVQFIVEQQKRWVSESLTCVEPTDSELKQAESLYKKLEQDLINKREHLDELTVQAEKLLIERDLEPNSNFAECLSIAKQEFEEQKYTMMEEAKEQGPWLSFMKDWSENLTADKPAQYDWEHVSQSFVENCNLVAISCNESDKTLKDAGIESFDTVIIDEVSKATPVELLLPLMRARRAVLVGDHRQLPPVFQESQDAQAFTDKVEEAEEENDNESLLTKDNLHRFEKMVTASLFKEHFENADTSIKERLTNQFRMHPQIMSLVNHFYDRQLAYGFDEKDKIKDARKNTDEEKEVDKRHKHYLKFGNNKKRCLLETEDHVLWIDTSNDLKGKPFKENEDRTNRMEAKLIAQTLVEINKQYKQKGFNKSSKQKVGVVSFYAAQCRVIRDEIKKHNHGKMQFDAIHVEINTVIRYQGKEKPIILMSLVRNDGGPKDKRRSAKANVARFEFINVAMSRAQNLLIIFGARNMLELRDVWLPNMDKPGKQKKQVYRQIFAQLDRDARIFDAIEMAEHFDKSNPVNKGVSQ